LFFSLYIFFLKGVFSIPWDLEVEFERECINGSWYLTYEIRIKLLLPLIEMVKRARKSFGLCREGLDLAEKGKCDGSFLINSKAFHVEHQ
jgi:hypothetical protein